MLPLPSLALAAWLAFVPPAANDSLIVSTSWLAARLEDPNVVVLHITMADRDDAEYMQGHVPGARPLGYSAITPTSNGLGTELPPIDQLRGILETVGVSSSSHVVVYAHDAPMATRAILTLHYLGHTRVSLLDGGFARWKAEGRRIATDVAAPPRGRITSTPRSGLVVSAAWIQPRLGKAGTALVDTRTDEEYSGTGGRRGMPSAGHLEGARQLQWEQLFQSSDQLALKPRAEIAALFSGIAQAGDTVVTYCWVGYRASATWFAATLLGYDAVLYDGSYQDWQKRALPVRAGTKP